VAVLQVTMLIGGLAANSSTELCTSKTLAVACSQMAHTVMLAVDRR
jgi:hypothetical protein